MRSKVGICTDSKAAPMTFTTRLLVEVSHTAPAQIKRKEKKFLYPSLSRTQAPRPSLTAKTHLPVGNTAGLEPGALASVQPQGQLVLWAWAVSRMVP